MRVIAKGTLREFWESSSAYADSETPLVEWYRHMEKAVYSTLQEVKGGAEASKHPQRWQGCIQHRRK